MLIANRTVGKTASPLIIAEMSGNHNQSLERALKIVDAAAKTGAHALKIQTYTPDTMTLDLDEREFHIRDPNSPWAGTSLYKLYGEAYTPWEWHEELFRVANEEGLICFSSPFDPTSVEFLEGLNCPVYKIASFEITDIPLIELVASKGKPIIISTGIATEDDIELALDACRRMGNNQIALLKCTSSYPAPIEEANLIMIQDMAHKYNVITGLSDHTMGQIAPVVATCFGAKIIEKHFILDRSIGGPDASFSMNEHEFTEMVNAVRAAEKAIGKVDYNLTQKQIEGRVFCRSLYVVGDIKEGELITEKNLRSIRPGYGMHPKELKNLIGKRAIRNFKFGERANEKLLFNG